MQNWKHFIAAALVGTMGLTSAQAGNYRPTQPTTAAPITRNTSVAQTIGASAPQKATSANGETKSAFWNDPCYTTPIYTQPFCGTPIVRCNTYCSPRTYYPVSNGYYGGGFGGYGNYGGGFGGYGNGGYGNGGYLNGGFGNGGFSGYGYSNYGPSSFGPGYGMQTLPGYSSPLMSPVSPVIPALPGYSSPLTVPGNYSLPGYAPGNWNVGYSPMYNNGLNGGYGAPVLPSPYFP